MAKESVHAKLGRVRPPRVHITYEVEVGDAIEIKELPFVMGVLGDFTGQPTEPLPRLRDRKFTEVNPDNFDSVLDGMKPHLAFTVENKLSEDGGQMGVDLKFNSIEDFEPARVAQQVPALRTLLETRAKLRDLMSKVDRSEELESLLEQVLRSEDEIKALSSQLGLGKQEG